MNFGGSLTETKSMVGIMWFGGLVKSEIDNVAGENRSARWISRLAAAALLVNVSSGNTMLMLIVWQIILISIDSATVLRVVSKLILLLSDWKFNAFWARFPMTWILSHFASVSIYNHHVLCDNQHSMTNCNWLLTALYH